MMPNFLNELFFANSIIRLSVVRNNKKTGYTVITLVGTKRKLWKLNLSLITSSLKSPSLYKSIVYLTRSYLMTNSRFATCRCADKWQGNKVSSSDPHDLGNQPCWYGFKRVYFESGILRIIYIRGKHRDSSLTPMWKREK